MYDEDREEYSQRVRYARNAQWQDTVNRGAFTRVTVNSAFPGIEQPPEKNQLPKMIRIVVGQKQCFAKKRLPLTVWKRSIQISGAVGNQFFHGFRVSPEIANRMIPGMVIRRRFCRRPVSGRPLR